MHPISRYTAIASRGGDLVRKFKAAVASWRKDELRGVNRSEFEQIARDLDLSPPELYGLLTGRRISSAALDECLAAKLEVSQRRLRVIERQRRAAAAGISFPIAPCC